MKSIDKVVIKSFDVDDSISSSLLDLNTALSLISQ